MSKNIYSIDHYLNILKEKSPILNYQPWQPIPSVDRADVMERKPLEVSIPGLKKALNELNGSPRRYVKSDFGGKTVFYDNRIRAIKKALDHEYAQYWGKERGRPIPKKEYDGSSREINRLEAKLKIAEMEVEKLESWIADLIREKEEKHRKEHQEKIERMSRYGGIKLLNYQTSGVKKNGRLVSMGGRAVSYNDDGAALFDDDKTLVQDYLREKKEEKLAYFANKKQEAVNVSA